MPADPPLRVDERTVLNAIMQLTAGPTDKTAEALAETTGLERAAVDAALRSLGSRTPPLVRPLIDEGEDIQFWVSAPPDDVADATAT